MEKENPILLLFGIYSKAFSPASRTPNKRGSREHPRGLPGSPAPLGVCIWGPRPPTGADVMVPAKESLLLGITNQLLGVKRRLKTHVTEIHARSPFLPVETWTVSTRVTSAPAERCLRRKHWVTSPERCSHLKHETLRSAAPESAPLSFCSVLI